MSWTDDRVATLTKLWADGLSASQIAAELGGVTRNAVIGKVHRLGLSGRAKTSNSSARKIKTPTRSGGYNTRPVRTSRTPAVRAPVQSSRPAIEDIPVPVSKKLLLEQLTDKTCKWPDGDPSTDDFHFCGNTPHEDAPYCKYHCRMAYHTASDRRREKKVVNG